MPRYILGQKSLPHSWGIDGRWASQMESESSVLILNGSSYNGIQKSCTALCNICLIIKVLAHESLKEMIRCKLHLELSNLLHSIKNTMDFIEDDAWLSKKYKKKCYSTKSSFLPGRIYSAKACTCSR